MLFTFERVHDKEKHLIVNMYVDFDQKLAVDGFCFNLLPGVAIEDGIWDDDVRAYYHRRHNLDLSAHPDIPIPDGDNYALPYYEEYGCVVFTPDFDFSFDVPREELKAKYPMMRDLA